MPDDDAVTPRRPDAGEWVQLSARLQRVAALHTRRTDLVVRISPQLEPDHAAWSGWYRHDLAEIRLPAAVVLGERAHPDAIDLTTRSGRRSSPVLAGVMSLAAAHALHTAQPLPPDLDRPVANALDLLERLRVLRIQLADHPADRRWLRAAATLFATAHAPDSPVWVAAGTLGLELAGALGGAEAQRARRYLTTALGGATVFTLEQIVRESTELRDGAVEELRTHARELVELLGTPRSVEAEDRDAATRELESLRGALDELNNDDSTAAAPERTPAVREEDLRLAEHELARAAAADSFAQQPDDTGTVYRDPSPELRRAARLLAATLRRAQYRAAETTWTSRDTPPGRLRLSEAMRRQAQRAAGSAVTAQPWLRLCRRTVELPPLRVGLSWDISRSRSELHSRMAELAWALSWAMHHIDGRLAALAWNSRARAVQWPGRVPEQVAEPPCGGTSSGCPQSLRALEGALDLYETRGARIVIATTDGRIPNRRAVGVEVSRLVRNGVSVLWVTSAPDARTPSGAVNVVLSDPDTLVATLGDAVCQILARAAG